MTPPVFPELAVIAKVETIEAVARNVEEAILFEISSVVGTTDVILPSLASSEDCMFFLGDGTVNKVMARMMTILCRVFQGVFNRLEDFGRTIADTIRDVLGSVIDSITRGVDNIISALTSAISNAIAGLAATVSRIIDTIVDTLSSIVDAITEQVRLIVNGLQDIIGAIFNKISDVVQAIFNKIETVFTGLLNAATAVFDTIKGGVTAVLEALLNAAEFVFDRIGGALTGLIETLTGVAEGGLARIREVIESIPETLREVFQEAREFAGDVIGKPLANMGNLFVTQIEEFFAKLIDELEVSPEKILREFFTGIGLDSSEVERFAQAADRAMPRTPAIFALGAVAIIPLVIGPVVSAILAPAIQQVSQEVAQRITPTLIPPANAVDALLRGTMSEDQFRNDLGEAGYNRERQDILVSTSRRLLDLGELFRWWLRGIIDDSELDTQLGMLRVDPVDRDRLKEAVFFIPPVGDLIRMAVREVFSPEIRERFGQDEGFPEEFAEFAEQQGVSGFWAKAFWAAHWALPSPQQGFEMLHRKVIDTADLDLLLRAQDVMPFWRDKLVDIAFRPLTRVDLRRMHKLGIFDEEELQRRYEDLGFASDNAALMVQFTLAFNAEDPPEDPGELEGLTRATVLGMYEDGIITRAQAGEVMVELGFSREASELFLLQRDLEIERATRRDEIQLVLDLVRAGAIDFEAGQDRLAQLGLQPTELAKATTAVLRERERQTSIPPRGDLDKMLAARLINDSQYVAALNSRGFTRFWADRYLSLATQA